MNVNRRNFLKITMGVMGSAMGINAAADTLQGVSDELPKPPTPFDFSCDATEGKVAPKLSKSEILQAIQDAAKVMDEADIPTDGRYIAPAGEGDIISFDNLINSKTSKTLRVKRTINGWEGYYG